VRARGLQARPAPGTRVRLTGIFLRDTGQQLGGEGQSVWRVMECSCLACAEWEGPNACPLVAVDEPGTGPRRPRQKVRWRHIAAWNLEIVGAPPRAADYP
jgi:hypothetical protein